MGKKYKKFILFNIFIGLFCYSELFSQIIEEENEVIYFIVDLDGVLLFIPAPYAPLKKTLIAAEEKYRIAEWGPEFLQYLSEIPNAQVSFFSFGSLERNIEAIQKIVLPNGKTAIDIATDLDTGFIRLVGREQVDEYEFEMGNVSKDLSYLPFEISLKKAILIDDNYNSAPTSQKSNLLYVYNSTMGEYPNLINNRYVYEEEHALNIRGELFRVTGIIQKVLEAGKVDGNYVKALAQLLWKDGAPTESRQVRNYNSEVIFHKDMYQLGNSILSRISSK